MLARINDTKTLNRCLNTAGMEIVDYSSDTFGALYLRPSQEAGCVDLYDIDNEYIFSMEIDEIEFDYLGAKFDHNAVHMDEYYSELKCGLIDKEEYEEKCLNEYLDLYEGVELYSFRDEDYEF